MMQTLIAAALLLTAVSSAADERGERTRAYIALVEQYRTGDTQLPVETLGKWTHEELADALRGLPDRLRTTRDGGPQLDQDQPTTLDAAEPRRPTPLQLLATAMVLHAHVARSGDARDAIAVERHLGAAERLFELGSELERKKHRITRLPPDAPARQRFAALWHGLAGTIAMAAGLMDRAGTHFETAQRIRADEPSVLIGSGSFHEMRASSLGGDQRRKDLTNAGTFAQMSAETHLKLAYDAYERALALDPAPWGPRLRYARVAHLLGRSERAEAEIARVLDSAPNGAPQYLARLMAGAIAEGSGRMEEAIAQYRGAHYLCDHCQSVNLSLSHALLRAGDAGAAVQMIDRLLDVASPLHRDPWWGYYLLEWQVVDELLEQVRRAVPR